MANMFAGCSTVMPRKAHTQNTAQIQRQRNINPIFGQDDLILTFDGFDTVPSATKMQIVRNKGRPSAFLTNLGDSNTVYFAITHSRLIQICPQKISSYRNFTFCHSFDVLKLHVTACKLPQF